MRASASLFVLATAISSFNGVSGAAIPPIDGQLASPSFHYRIGTPVQTPGAVKRSGRAQEAGKFPLPIHFLDFFETLLHVLRELILCH